MNELNCVIIFQDKAGTIAAYYPFTKWRNILDAPPVETMESDLYGHIGNTDVHVTAVQIVNYDTAITGLIAHTEDGGTHTTPEQKTKWSAAVQTAEQADANAAEAMNRAAELASRVSRVEDGLFKNITGNPFLVSFDSLTGIVLTKGVWNAGRQRIEC